ncbi:hypothetical protein [uncultured Hymenobacter sp.]
MASILTYHVLAVVQANAHVKATTIGRSSSEFSCCAARSMAWPGNTTITR